MEQIQERKWSKLALISFILITLFLLYTIVLVTFSSVEPEGSLVKVRQTIFPVFLSLIIYGGIFVLNLVAFIICKRNPGLKGKLLSAFGMIFSIILISYVILGSLRGAP